MKDLVELFEDNERKFRSGGFEDEARCHFCRQRFPKSDLQPVGEHMIRGRYVRNAKACETCAPDAYEEDSGDDA